MVARRIADGAVANAVRLLGRLLDDLGVVGGLQPKVPSDEQPTSKQTSVTLRSPRRSSAIARSMRRVMR